MKRILAWIRYHLWYKWVTDMHYTFLLAVAGKENRAGMEWVISHCDELEKTDGRPPFNVKGNFRKAVCRHEVSRIVFLCKKSVPLMDVLGY